MKTLHKHRTVDIGASCCNYIPSHEAQISESNAGAAYEPEASRSEGCVSVKSQEEDSKRGRYDLTTWIPSHTYGTFTAEASMDLAAITTPPVLGQ